MTRRADIDALTPSVLYCEGRIVFDDLWSTNRAVKKCLDKARLVAGHEIDVLVLGESGTGKNLLAQAIHNGSPRAGKAFVAVNVAAIPESLLEAELFGCVKGAFTGAEDRKGYFEQAHGGTLFLDEIGNLSLSCQAKILTAVEAKRIRRLGAQKDTACDIRLIAATNADFKAAVAEGRFREDLLHRLNRLPITLPPLRARAEDIQPLAERFVEQANAKYGRNVKGIAQDCLARMLDYPWPGNLRELRSRVDAAVALCLGEELGIGDVFPELADEPTHVTQPGMELALETMERRHILKVLRTTGWNITRAAELLHISRPTLYEKISRYGLERPSQTH